MATTTEAALRAQLVLRHQRLETVLRTAPHADLEGLLHEVDAALERLDRGAYGYCEECNDPIEMERLLSDPSVRVCLDCLSSDQRRALEHDLRLAGQIQSGLLPDPDLSFDGWALSCHYAPYGPVSGDYYDVIRPDVGGTDTIVLFGDVSGKGISASLVMANLHATFRSLVASADPLARLVERANRLFCQHTLSSMYATLVSSRLTPSGSLEIANAGHCPPLLLREDRIQILAGDGLPFGMFCNTIFTATCLEMQAGDALVLYTDGLSEARNQAGAEYGVDRITAVLERQNESPPEATIRSLLRDLADFREGWPLADDLSVMVLRRT